MILEIFYIVQSFYEDSAFSPNLEVFHLNSCILVIDFIIMSKSICTYTNYNFRVIASVKYKVCEKRQKIDTCQVLKKQLLSSK